MLFPRLLAFICVLSMASTAAVLPPDELEALRVTLDTLGKRDWDFSSEVPCNRSLDPSILNYTNAVDCNCTFENETDACHVTRIYLKKQNLTGSLPPVLVGLPFLQVIDLSQNYLNGTIPPQWGSMKLTNISLIGNRVTGSMPKELANIAPLQELVLEYNQLSGTIPPEFGSLTHIKRLLFSSNNLTGELPPDLAKLTTLTDFRISDNSFIGSIPNFIQNWTNITKLVIQASGLTGPIPAGIASLTKLSDLRISDLNGNIESAFPSLNKMSSMDTLILRSCNIVGELPEDFGEMKIKNVFDLSFNNLTGQIPDSYVFLENTSHIYLTGNSLTGKLPNWMSNLGSVDLSYNNINITSGSSPPNCRGPNLFANSRGNTPGTFSCVKINCRPTYHYFHINCGGSQSFRDENGFIYEEDPDSAGASDFFQSYSNWGFSTTGRFMDGEGHRYTLQNSSSISGPDSKLYMDARLSPLSLTYYGFCLINGKYRVELHFAEIKFTDDRTYRSLGRRIFDVYIQGTQVLKDFNIENKADGVNKPVIEQFTAAVTDNTLEIRFYWAGKGTQRIPDGGDYGPLVSAISAIRTDQKKGPKKIIIILVVVGFVIISICTYFSWKWIAKYRGMKQTIVLGNAGASGPVDTYLQDAFNEVNLEELPFYKFEILVNATNNFSEANKLGKGGFGSVYKGNMANGREIAVKRLSQASRQGVQEFMNELVLISKLQHRNLVKLLGCCVENNETMLIYEYMPNKSLDFFLFDQSQGILDWRKRFKIIEGICRGLLYLHRDSRLKIIHRDLKPSNILLDNDWNAKISDFGLARIFGTEQDHVSTVRVVGTYGYMAPEYVIEGKFSEKSDVFSFGVLILEIATGKRNKSFRQDGSLNLLGHVWKLWNEDGAAALIDKRISSSSYQAEVMRCIHIGLLCVQELPKDRPSILAVLSMLSSEIMELPEPKRSAFAIESSHSDTGTSSSQQSQKHSSSINNVTLTMVDDGR